MSVMRVKEVQSARKSPGRCRACGEMIEVGDSYRYASSRFYGKVSRHTSCPPFKQSELETTCLASAYAAQEDASDALGDLAFPDDITGDEKYETVAADVTSILEAAAEGAQETIDESQSSLDNMPDGLREGDTGQMIQDRIDAVESWVDELGSWQPDNQTPEDDQDDDDWLEEIKSSAQDVVDSLEA